MADNYQGSIVVPVLNEAEGISAFLLALEATLQRPWKVIVVDGGSSDATCQLVSRFPVLLLHSERGRAKQMNLGAAHVEGDVLLFLHADTQLPMDFELQMDHFFQSGLAWGRFDLLLQPASTGLSVVSWFINYRSRLTGVATGDQAIFVKPEAFSAVAGFPDIPLMEDVAFSKKLKGCSRAFCSHGVVRSSSRRWQSNGLAKTVLLMWILRLAYFCGVSPRRLHRLYYPTS